MLATWQSITLWKRVLIGLVIGLAVGLGLRYGLGPQQATAIGNTWFKPFGDAFVRLIKMLVIPLVFTTLISGVTAMGDPKKLGSLGAKTIGLYLLTTLFAVSLGLAIGTFVKPGEGVKYANADPATEESTPDAAQENAEGEPENKNVAAVQQKLNAAAESGTFVDRLLEIIPTNPVEALATGAVLPTIFFAVMVGIGILTMGASAAPVKDFFDAAAEVVMAITVMVMELAPVGVLALMGWVMATQGIEVLSNLGWLAFSLYLACFFQIIFVYGGLIVGGILRLPLMAFFRGVADAQGVAFSTASSSGTLPVTINCAEKNLGVNKSVASSVLPLGATINMDGTAIYLGLIALFAAQAAGMPLTATQYVMVAMTATLVSIGAAGIPSAGLLLAATVLDVIGIPEEQALLVIAFIYPFDRLLDMMRTVTNVTGDVAVACTVAKWEGALDEDQFRRAPVTTKPTSES
jgi:Na+/H+-dicarboxylate symporter